MSLLPLSRSPTSSARSLVRTALLALAALALPLSAQAGPNHPATQALEEAQGKVVQKNVIQNRFFLKQNRFEIAPNVGYVPNNAFVTSPTTGVFLAYHFNENIAAEGTFLYAPNTGDAGIKNLTHTLIGIAYDGNTDTSFKQPLDRVQLGAIFDARWAPVYGKINLIGEGVLNFDWYGTGGLGLLMVTKDAATVNPEWVQGVEGADPATSAAQPVTEPNLAVNLGIGFDFFLSQSVALKLDARSLLYVAEEPDYGNVLGDGTPEPLENRLYNTFVTSLGVSIFVPKMKPRIYNF